MRKKLRNRRGEFCDAEPNPELELNRGGGNERIVEDKVLST
jgi:hypothetical protein